MYETNYKVRPSLEPYVNCIMIHQTSDTDALTRIPLYADGYPGIMFQQSTNGFYLLPKQKQLSELYLYGQTLEPITLEAKGPSEFIVFQLFPFASKFLLGVDPKILNDDCYNLLKTNHVNGRLYLQKLKDTKSSTERIEILSDLMIDLSQATKHQPNDEIQQAISIILKKDGILKINSLLDEIYLSERTFERKFKAEIGLLPKQFARIIQFQKSISILNESNFEKLTEVGFDSGFNDQSHFIRTFKNYTGQTPSYFLKQNLRG